MLQKVSIQNFKSLKDVTLELQKVNILIGPNNSGKSNFLKALELWGKYLPNKKDENKFIKNKDNFQEYTFKNRENKLSFGIGFNNAFYEYFIQEDNDRDLVEGLLLNSIPCNPYLNSGLTDYDYREFKNFINDNISSDITVYKINPNSFLQPMPINGLENRFILSDGSNIVPFLDYLKDEHKSSYRRLEHDLQKCIPEFTDINLKTVNSPDNDQRTYKIWGLGNDNEKYWADEVSEGVLYFLALLCIVHQPNPPKLLLLEEPEKGIHPRRIHEVMNFIFQLAEDKDIQVIMTSHNEHVLEEFAIIPEAVFIFDKDDEGATFVKNLQKDIIEPDTKKAIELGIDPIDYTDNIGDNWFMGLMGGVPA